MNEGSGQPPIIVRRVKRVSGGHHGGAWKVAYADFVTAMMAFFLVMWLLGIGSKQQRAAIAEYFKNPSMVHGTSVSASPGPMGPGGASNSMIKLGGAMDLPKPPIHGKSKSKDKLSPAQAEKEARKLEHKRLEQLREQLHAAIEQSQALKPFKDQLFLDITPRGLRIQIVDKKNRPMFDTGSARLKPYTVKILDELAGFINTVPNRITISGHTDDKPYSSAKYFSNWELSADRANAARRALVQGGMQAGKVAQVIGLADSVPFDKADPGAAINRRISIIVMTHDAARAALAPETAGAGDPPRGTLPDVPVLKAGSESVKSAPTTAPKTPTASATQKALRPQVSVQEMAPPPTAGGQR